MALSKEERIKRVRDLAGARYFDDRGRLVSPEIEPVTAVPRRLPRAMDLSLRDHSPLEVAQIMSAHGLIPDPRYLIDEAAEYVARMTNKSGPAYWAEVDRVLNRDGLLPAARRATERYGTLLGLGGDLDTEVVWVADGGEGTCDPCARLAGTIEQYSTLAARGTLPGSSVCDGGDRCRCELVPIE